MIRCSMVNFFYIIVLFGSDIGARANKDLGITGLGCFMSIILDPKVDRRTDLALGIRTTEDGSKSEGSYKSDPQDLSQLTTAFKLTTHLLLKNQNSWNHRVLS